MRQFQSVVLNPSLQHPSANCLWDNAQCSNHVPVDYCMVVCLRVDARETQRSACVLREKEQWFEFPLYASRSVFCFVNAAVRTRRETRMSFETVCCIILFCVVVTVLLVLLSDHRRRRVTSKNMFLLWDRRSVRQSITS